MADRNTRAYYEETFSRDDDASGVGGNWTTTGAALQIVNQTARQSGSSAGATASILQAVTTAAPDCGADYEAFAVAACDDDAAARQGTIVLRATGAIATSDAYGVTLKWDGTGAAEALTVLIRKLNGGTWATLTSVDVTADKQVGAGSSYDSVFQRLGADIRTVDGNVVIRAYFEDEERPVLEWTDQTYPMLTQAGSFGFYMEDNDAGVDGHILLKSIVLNAIQQRTGDEAQPAYWTAGKLLEAVAYGALRGGKSNADKGQFRDLLNEAIQEYAVQLGAADWWKEEYTFKIIADATSVVLPANTRSVSDTIWDETAGTTYHLSDGIRARDIHRDTTTSADPYLFWLEGNDADGGQILRCWPAPSTTRTYKIVRYRWPRPLIDDHEVPDLPQPLAPALKWGALQSYSMRDSDRTHIQAASAKWNEWIARGRRMANTKVMGRTSRHLNFGERHGNNRRQSVWGY